MKTKDFKNTVSDIIFKEVKKKILSESEEGTKEVYHIKCEGVPLATFKTEKAAQEALPQYKKDNDGELIIEKGVYESHDDMLDKLDEMSDELGEEEEPTEGNAFTKKLKDTPKGGKFKLGDKEFTDNSDLDEEDECNECGDKEMMEKLHGDQHKLDKDKDGKLTKKDFLMMLQNKKDSKQETNEDDFNKWLDDTSMDSEGGEQEVAEGGMGTCNECGSMLNEEGVCNECMSKMNESKKKVLRLTEKEMIETIKKIVKESIPGEDVTKKAQSGSKKSNQENINNVSKKIKDYQSIPNNENPKFPHQNGGEKVARHNSSKEDEIVADNRGGTMVDLNYDHEPSENFKKRLKMSLEGDALMGNSQDYANVAEKSDIGKKLADKAERNDKKKKKEPQVSWGHAWKEPETVKVVNESKETKISSDLKKEIEKMKNMSTYNKKTQ